MKRIRVLVADDEELVGRTLRELLSSEPDLVVVGLALDAGEAVRLILEHRPDVALVDFKMPGGGGAHVARVAADSCPETRVVALSAYEDRNSVFQMLRSGAIGYLVKGTSAAEITATVRQAALGQSVIGAEVASDVVFELTDRLKQDEDLDRRRHDQVERIRRAVETVDVVFQPIVELDSRSEIGFEALSRFDLAPQRAPATWFAEAGEVGLLTDLELAATRNALAALPLLPRDAFVSVNLSPSSLLSDTVLEELAAADPRRVVVEVTEHAQIDDYETLNQALLELRAAGLRLAIDDAGAGYASLRHVLEIHPDIIKLDSSLTRRIESERAARALATALITFAGSMGQTAVAEGIENEQTCAALARLGVEYGQGYHLGQPAPLPAPTLF